MRGGPFPPTFTSIIPRTLVSWHPPARTEISNLRISPPLGLLYRSSIVFDRHVCVSLLSARCRLAWDFFTFRPSVSIRRLAAHEERHEASRAPPRVPAVIAARSGLSAARGCSARLMESASWATAPRVVPPASSASVAEALLVASAVAMLPFSSAHTRRGPKPPAVAAASWDRRVEGEGGEGRAHWQVGQMRWQPPPMGRAGSASHCCCWDTATG